MFFNADNIDVSGISPSVLANSGLLMACFIVSGKRLLALLLNIFFFNVNHGLQIPNGYKTNKTNM
jgi:hypothetical protein